MDKVVLLYNTSADGCFPSDFIGKYHVHILCLKGMMQFDFANQTFQLKENDFAIWQLGSEINNVLYSTDFEADFLLVERQFLLEYNPETLWATKAYVYIKRNPLFHLDAQEKELVKADFHGLRHFNNLYHFPLHTRVLGIFIACAYPFGTVLACARMRKFYFFLTLCHYLTFTHL